MSFVFFCRIGTCRPCARGVSGAGLRLFNVRRAKILFSAVIFFLPAAIFSPSLRLSTRPEPSFFSVSFAPFDPPAAFLFPVRPFPSRLLPAPPAACLFPVPFFPFVPARCLPLSRLPFPFRFPCDLVPAPSAVFLFPGLSRPSLPSRLRSGPVCRLPLSRPPPFLPPYRF